MDLILSTSISSEVLPARKHIQASAVSANPIAGLLFKGTGVFNLWREEMRGMIMHQMFSWALTQEENQGSFSQG